MKLNGLIWQNIKKAQQDYFIYVISLIFQHALLFSSNLIEVGISTQNVGANVSNSLPMVIVITMISFGLFMTRFMIRQRSKEFATYMLAGLSKHDIMRLYGSEVLMMEIGGLIIGSLVGYLFSLIFGYSMGDRTFLYLGEKAIGNAFFLTLLYSIVIFTFVFLYSCIVIKKTTLRELMYRKFYNEQPYKVGKWCSILLICSLIIFLLQLFFIKNFAVSGTLFPVLSVLLVAGQLCILERMRRMRENSDKLYEKNGRLFRKGLLMSKQRSQVKLSAVLSLCFLLSFVCYVLGAVFMNAGKTLIDAELDHFMGVAQSYFSIIFLMAIIGVIGIKQTTEVMEQQKNINILSNLGMSRDEIKCNLFLLSVQSYINPMIVGIFISGITFAVVYNQDLLDNWMKAATMKGVIQFILVFILVLVSFVFVTYRGYIQLVNKKNQRED